MRTYQYKGFTVEVAVESNCSWTLGARTATPAYVGLVTIARIGRPVAMLPPFRLGDVGGKAFASEAEALMTGYSAARRIVDDLLAAEIYR